MSKDMTIKATSMSAAIALLFSTTVVVTASAQNLFITNARIIVGNGEVIEEARLSSGTGGSYRLAQARRMRRGCRSSMRAE